ncbi:MAG: RnfABCDGE type electron transport complex subunit D [Clostridiales bacterium]|nr:RnfABCDGE type electron transport complex subunit D [Clostridiales bacterium]
MNDEKKTATPSKKSTEKTEKALYTVTSSPHIKAQDTSRSIMIDVLIALAPAMIWAVYVFGFRSLTITLISVLSCVGFEFLYQKLLHKPITILDFSACVTGVLIGFNLPSTAPLWLPIAGSFFAIVIVKQLFGGIGKNIVNPTLAARVFLFSWTTHMTTFAKPFEKLSASAFTVKLSEDVIATATPMVYLNQGALPQQSLLEMFLGIRPGVIGEVSVLLLLAGGVYLLIRKVITWHIPVAYILTVGLVSIFTAPAGNAIDYSLAQMMGGGLILGAVFMATDYTTSPVNNTARLIFGVGCGLLTVFIRIFGGYSEGVSFSILIMNLLVYYLDRFTKPIAFGKRKSNKGAEVKENGKS